MNTPTKLTTLSGKVASGTPIDPPNKPTTNKRPPLRSADRPKPALFSDPTKSIAENTPPVSKQALARIGARRVDNSRRPGLQRRLSLRRIDVGDDRTHPVKRVTQADRSKAKAARADDQERVLGIHGSRFFQRAEGRKAGAP